MKRFHGCLGLARKWHLYLAVLVCAVAAHGVGVIAGTAWEANGVSVCQWPGAQESPYLAALGGGQTIVVWADTRNFDYDIYAQKLDADGNPVWAAGGVKICEAIYDQQFPTAVSDGSGGAIIVWQDGRLGDDGLDLYAQRIASDGTIAWQIDGIPVCSHPSGLTDPPMAFSHVTTSDGSGGMIVAWRDTRNDPINGNTEIYAQKVSSAGATGWTPNGVQLLGFSTLKWSTRTPVIASDGAGGAVVAWQDARTSATTANDLYAQRIISTGATAWNSNGVAVCNAAGDQGYPDITHLGAGEIALVWEDKRSGNYDIYAQRLSPSGSAQWGTNGRLICSSANDQRTPRVVANGTDAVIAWTDKRSSTVFTDVYAQKLDSAGAALWQSQGAAVCTAVGSQTRIRMCPSVSGLTILSWMDTRNETVSALYDIYGQMIDSSAAPRWAAAGVPVAAITGNNQRMHQAISDGAGGLAITWEDDRNTSDWDIYAQRLTPWTAVERISDAKALPAGEMVSIAARAVTGSFSGCFYIEESNRTSGIRVEHPQAFPPGSLVAVNGTVEFDLEPYIKASDAQACGTITVPDPLGITAARLGITPIGQLPALTGVGLLIRTWGTVVSKPSLDQPYVVVGDGTAQVRVSTTADVEVGDTVVVTGVCSLEPSSGGAIASILTRDASDVYAIEL